MKKIYLREEQIPHMKNKNLLPKFLFSLVKKHSTSLGDNPAFPPIENFDYHILKKRLKELNVKLEANDLSGYSNDELLNLLSKLMFDIKKIETPIRKQLEVVCENAINRLFAFPDGLINFSCELVDKIKPVGKNRITPEERDDNSYAFEDLEDIKFSNGAIAKRRIINSLIQGGAHTLVNEYDTYAGAIHKLNPKLMEMYHTFNVVNEYLTFVLPEKISDQKPNQGAYVQVKLGTNGDKTEIKVQGLNFPLLLIESIRGFLELFSSHGLPNDSQKAKYVISQSDFLSAEPFDIRFGTVLWDMILPQNIATPSNAIPYYFMKLCKLKKDNFNKVIQEMFGETKRGERLKQRLLQYAKDEQDYSGFVNRINARKIDKAQINDGYFSAADLDSFNEEGEEIELNEAILFETRAEDKARKIIKQETGYDKEEREEALNDIRSFFPILRSGAAKKFIWGVTRLYFAEEFHNDDMRAFNYIFKYFLKKPEIIESVPASLEGYTIQSFIDAFYDDAKMFFQGMETNETEHTYEIVKIKSFDEACEYNDYLLDGNQAWCITWSESNYNSYTHNNSNIFYFMLRDDFKQVEPIAGEDTPYDDYGMSMIAICVNPNGDMVNSTTRWNHENGGNDDSFTTEEVERLIGKSFNDVFLPRSEKDYGHEVRYTTKSGLQWITRGPDDNWFLFDPNANRTLNMIPYEFVEIFNEDKDYYNVSAKYKDYVMTGDGDEICSYSSINRPVNGYACVKDEDMSTFINLDGEQVCDWFDSVYDDFMNGFAIVENRNHYAYLSEETMETIGWFDRCRSMGEYFGCVTKGGKETVLMRDGTLIEDGNIWFDKIIRLGIPGPRECVQSKSAVGVIDNKEFIISPTGVVINEQYPADKVVGYFNFDNLTGYAIAINGGYMTLDDNGNEIINKN